MCINDKYLANLKAINNLYDFLNQAFFENTLSKVVITMQRNKKEGVLGWFTAYEAWQAENESSPEINLSADYLDRTPLQKAETLLHEMCHFYNYKNKIKDCSRGGTYHNKSFKNTAEKFGLTVNQDPRGGWCVTTLTKKSEDIIQKYIKDIDLLKRVSSVKSRQAKSSSTRKYICTSCGLSVRATKEVNIKCVECDCTLIEE